MSYALITANFKPRHLESAKTDAAKWNDTKISKNGSKK